MKIDDLRQNWHTDAGLTGNMVTGNPGRMVTYEISNGLHRLSDITGAKAAAASGLPQPVVLDNQVTAHTLYVVDCVEGTRGKLRVFALGMHPDGTPRFNGEYKYFGEHWYNAVTGSPAYEAAFAHGYSVLTSTETSGSFR